MPWRVGRFFPTFTQGNDTMKRLSTFILFTLIIASCAQVGNLALKLMTPKENDLSKMAGIGYYMVNNYGAETGVTMGTGGKDFYEGGKNYIGIQFVKAEGIGFYNFDGAVTVDGDTTTSLGAGFYVVKADRDDLRDRTVRIASPTGQTAEFPLKAPVAIRIKSINGSTDNPVIDLTKPLTVELDFPNSARGKTVHFSLVINVSMAGVKGFANFFSTTIAPTITIPAEAFKHTHITGGAPSGASLVSFKEGENFLKVEIAENSGPQTLAPFAYFKTQQNTMDTKAISVEGETAGVSYMKAEGTLPAPSGEFGVRVTGNNGWYVRPLTTHVQRLALGSFNLAGTLYKKEVSTSTTENRLAGTITTTTFTQEWAFPQLDDQYWNTFMENVYSDFDAMIKRKYGFNLVDVNQVTANPNYANFFEPKEANSNFVIRKNFRETKRLKAATIGEIVGTATTAMVADGLPLARLMRDLRLDGVGYITLDLQVGGDSDDKIILNPLLRFTIDGHNQLKDGFVSEWFTIQVYGAGVPFSREEFTDVNALNRILQKDALLAGLEKGLDLLLQGQTENGMVTVWAAKK